MELGCEKPQKKGWITEFLETTFIGFWMFWFTISGLFILPIFVYIVLFTDWYITRAIILFYFLWMYIDKDTPFIEGRTLDWFRQLKCWEYFRNYFPCTLVKTVDLDPKKNYLFITHPHGIFVFHAIGNIGMNKDREQYFPHHKFYHATVNHNFYFPLVRDCLIAKGAISFSKETVLNIISKKEKDNTSRCMTLVVGGAQESLYCKPNIYKLNLKNKMGFIKIGLQTGTSLVPVFGFGDVFDYVPNPPGSKVYKFQQTMMKLTQIGWCMPKGRAFLKLIPQRKPLTTVVGEPMDLPKIENPTIEEMRHYHGLYIEKLKKLFYDHKDKYCDNPETTELIID